MKNSGQYSPQVQELEIFVTEYLNVIHGSEEINTASYKAELDKRLQGLALTPTAKVTLNNTSVVASKRTHGSSNGEANAATETFDGPLGGLASVVQALNLQGISNAQIYQMLGDADQSEITDQNNSRARQVGGRSTVDDDLDRTAGNTVVEKEKDNATQKYNWFREDRAGKKVLRKAKEGAPKVSTEPSVPIKVKAVYSMPKNWPYAASWIGSTSPEQIASYGVNVLNKHVSNSMPKHLRLVN